MPAAITESRFVELKARLRELFELDKSDLDFGIYRIMAAKNRQVTDFIDRQLKDVVRKTLLAHGAAATDQVQAELAQAIQQANTLGADPDSLPKVKELKAKLAAVAGSASVAELEADIYNHLLAFFSRYYDEGDFISKRRYKGDTYAIPYNGEEVTLYWANKDQYYIKSGEWHKDYRFKIGGKSIHFKLIEATQETNNNKEPEDAKRRYILDVEKPIEADKDNTELILRFQFRVPTEAEKQAVTEATRIFGGNYDKAAGRTQGDQREQFCADAEKRALAAMPEIWKPLVTATAATESKPLRTVLGKHLDDFTARNIFDYFIHKDLGGFLTRELDFYIKNEVVRLDDLESLPADHLARVQGKIKAIRTVAGRIINFLAAIENFQKKMWLKKKCVLETHYCMTLDRVPVELYAEIVGNNAQREEWVKLFAIDEIKAEKLGEVAYSNPLTVEFLKAQPHLVLDTRHFSDTFQQKLLASIDDLDEKLDGLLIHSENFQALQLLSERYREKIDCVYIDPPYNTGHDGFQYKDGYQRATWLSLMVDRVSVACSLLLENGLFFSSIDFLEEARLREVGDQIFGNQNFLVKIIWEKRFTRSNNAKLFSTLTEAILAYRKSPAISTLRDIRNEKADSNYSNPDNDPRGVWTSVSYVNPATKAARPNLAYALKNPFTGEEIIHPTNAWKFERAMYEKHLSENRLYWGNGGTHTYPRLKKFLAEMEGMVPIDLWKHADVGTTDLATKMLECEFGSKVFEFPKPPSLIKRIASLASFGKVGGIFCDFFAGSGTTAHAVINLNRKDDGHRKYVLVEMGEYFHTVLLPRIKKVVYSKDWKDGKPIPTRRGDSGISHAFKYFALESYEDALNNLPAPTGNLLANADAATSDAFITYSLDLEVGPSLLRLEIFRDPWGYCINAQTAGEAEIRPHRVDIIETFNYLLGLVVKQYGPMERYSADFERPGQADNLGRLKVAGRLRRDKDGPFIFQRVEGELLDGTRVLVVWRKVSPVSQPGAAEQDAAVLDAWMDRHREDTKERSEHRDYHLIYINGPVTLPQPTADIRTVLPIEQTFKDRMFADADGGAP